MFSNKKIFVIDDESGVGDTIQEALAREGFDVTQFQNPEEALRKAAMNPPSLAVTDLVMAGLDGLEVLRRLKKMNPETNVIVLTGHASLESAIGAVRLGASDYLVKPFKIAELIEAVQKALSKKRLSPEVAPLDRDFLKRYDIRHLIGSTPEMKAVFALIEKVAKNDSTVLIVGESGTGKEVFARAIHYGSKQKSGEFVSINCAALPEHLLESELFGYEKGAFTGASGSKLGLLELASGGTFFLDEVGDMPLPLQAKLLRVLQERVLRRVGGIRDIKVEFRLIAATSKDLTTEMKERRFREDLYYRLNVIPIVLPPLRRRKEDIPLFVEHCLRDYERRAGLKDRLSITSDAMQILTAYDWPGNVRELENIVERFVALSEGKTIDAALIRQTWNDQKTFSSADSLPINDRHCLKESLAQYEKTMIERALLETTGNKNRAAQKLGLTRQALQYKLEKYGLR